MIVGGQIEDGGWEVFVPDGLSPVEHEVFAAVHRYASVFHCEVHVPQTAKTLSSVTEQWCVSIN